MFLIVNIGEFKQEWWSRHAVAHKGSEKVLSLKAKQCWTIFEKKNHQNIIYVYVFVALVVGKAGYDKYKGICGLLWKILLPTCKRISVLICYIIKLKYLTQQWTSKKSYSTTKFFLVTFKFKTVLELCKHKL